MNARQSFGRGASWVAALAVGFAVTLGCSGVNKLPDPPATDVDLPKCAGKVGGGGKAETLAHLAWGYMKDLCPSLPQELDVFASCMQSKAGSAQPVLGKQDEKSSLVVGHGNRRNPPIASRKPHEATVYSKYHRGNVLNFETKRGRVNEVQVQAGKRFL